MHACRTAAVANERYAARVTAKRSNILLQPVQCRNNIHEAVVGGRFRVAIGVGVQETCENMHTEYEIYITSTHPEQQQRCRR